MSQSYSWLGQVGLVARQDLKLMLRGKETMVWLFVMPIVFFYFIGTVTGGAGGGSSTKQSLALIREGEETGVAQGAEDDSDSAVLESELRRRLEQADFTLRDWQPQTSPAPNTSASADEAESQVATKPRRSLTLPLDLDQRMASGVATELSLRDSSEGMGKQWTELRVARAAYTVLADLLVLQLRSVEPTEAAFAALHQEDRPLTLTVLPAGKRQRIPTGYEQTVPGILVMFTLLATLTSGAILLVVERKQRLLVRWASTPVTRRALFAGKWLSRLVLALIQIAFAMAAGTVLFKMNWGSDWPAVLLLLLCWASFCASAGLFLGNLAEKEGQASAMGVLSTNILAALGGCWWPIEITPGWMQSLAGFLPTGWTMNGLHRLVSFQTGPAGAVGPMLLLLAGTVLLGWWTARKWRFQ